MAAGAETDGMNDATSSASPAHWVRLIVMKWLTSVTGHRIAVTGRTWCTQAELLRRARGLGANGNGRVTKDTTILVRGRSGVWAYGDYGRKEKHAAELLREGHAISVIHDFEFRKLLNGGRARISDRLAGEPVQWLSHVTKRQFQKVARLEGPLDREHSALGRVEQSFLRRILFGSADESVCSLCGRLLPTGLLVAAHIKPRSECTRAERLDFENIVFGLCVLGCDALYERGFVSVLGEGRICISDADGPRTLKGILRSFQGKTCVTWTESGAHYFDWHATRRFQGSNGR